MRTYGDEERCVCLSLMVFFYNKYVFYKFLFGRNGNKANKSCTLLRRFVITLIDRYILMLRFLRAVNRCVHRHMRLPKRPRSLSLCRSTPIDSVESLTFPSLGRLRPFGFRLVDAFFGAARTIRVTHTAPEDSDRIYFVAHKAFSLMPEI